MAPHCRPCLWSLLVVTLIVAGCKDTRIVDYRVPKESRLTPPPATTGEAGAASLRWTAPPQWTPKAGSAMRKGSYTVSGPEGEADLAITAFPGDVGGNLANINRWRGQLGQPPVAALEGAVQPLTANGIEMLVFDDANQDSRILGAIVSRPGETWFFKLTGPNALVARTKPAFLDFLRTVKTP